MDHPDFHVEKTVSAAPTGGGSGGGTEVAVEVVYEPSSLGESHATLSVSSAIGGEYTFPLVGCCTPPRPMGPFVVKSGGTVSVPFRNVFPTNTTFLFQLDNPAFHVPRASDSLRSHKDTKILVGFDGLKEKDKEKVEGAPPPAPVMAKLTVTAATSPAHQWIFYLKGLQ